MLYYTIQSKNDNKSYYMRRLLAVHNSSSAVTNGCSYSLLVQKVGTYTSSLTLDVERAR